jgi:hypothetical protein
MVIYYENCKVEILKTGTWSPKGLKEIIDALRVSLS